MDRLRTKKERIKGAPHTSEAEVLRKKEKRTTKPKETWGARKQEVEKQERKK